MDQAKIVEEVASALKREVVRPGFVPIKIEGITVYYDKKLPTPIKVKSK